MTWILKPLNFWRKDCSTFKVRCYLVSHDRDFLDNVVTATIALDGKGGISEYAGGCDEWLSQLMRVKEKPKTGSAQGQIPRAQGWGG